MRLTGVEIRDFRNLAEVEVFPHRRFNVLVGENGQGKTSFLEALYWLATLRPLRVARPREMVRHGADGARVAGERALAAVLRHVEADGTLGQVSYGTRMGHDLQFYRDIPIQPTGYGQSMALLCLVEALNHAPPAHAAQPARRA